MFHERHSVRVLPSGRARNPSDNTPNTRLVRWIIELYRVLPVTLRDVYHCGIDKELFARNIEQAQTYAADMGDEWISFAADDDLPHIADLYPSTFTRTRLTTPASARRRTRQRSRS